MSFFGKFFGRSKKKPVTEGDGTQQMPHQEETKEYYLIPRNFPFNKIFIEKNRKRLNHRPHSLTRSSTKKIHIFRSTTKSEPRTRSKRRSCNKKHTIKKQRLINMLENEWDERAPWMGVKILKKPFNRNPSVASVEQMAKA